MSGHTVTPQRGQSTRRLLIVPVEARRLLADYPADVAGIACVLGLSRMTRGYRFYMARSYLTDALGWSDYRASLLLRRMVDYGALVAVEAADWRAGKATVWRAAPARVGDLELDLDLLDAAEDDPDAAAVYYQLALAQWNHPDGAFRVSLRALARLWGAGREAVTRAVDALRDAGRLLVGASDRNGSSLQLVVESAAPPVRSAPPAFSLPIDRQQPRHLTAKAKVQAAPPPPVTSFEGVRYSYSREENLSRWARVLSRLSQQQ